MLQPYASPVERAWYYGMRGLVGLILAFLFLPILVIVPLSYAYQGQMGTDVVRGGAPYGMTTMSDGDGSRQPSAQELEGARFQGKRVAEIAAKLVA